MEKFICFSGYPDDVNLEVKEWLKVDKQILSKHVSSCTSGVAIYVQVAIFYRDK